MFHVSLAQFSCYLRDHLLTPEDSKAISWNDGVITYKALLVKLDVEMKSPEGVRRRAGVYLIFSGWTNVFAATVPLGTFFKDVPLDQFKNICNHDSEWRSSVSQYFNQLYFKWAEEIGGGRAPREMDTGCYLGSFTKHEFKRITMRPINPRDMYWKELVSVETWEE